MELMSVVEGLRLRVCEYRLEKTGKKEISTHLNAVDIVLCLVELNLKDKRPISIDEENWFKAGLYLSYVFDNSEWEDIRVEYEKIVTKVEEAKYFRQ